MQDQIEFSPQFEAVLGLRFDRFEMDFRNNRTGERLDSTDDLLSPREGLNAARHDWLDGGQDAWEQNYRDRLRQVAALVRHLAGNPRPLILAGDLNAAEASPVVRSLKELGLRDAFDSAGKK